MRLAGLVFASMLGTAVLAEDAPSNSAEVPIEQFTRHDESGRITISPDGEYLAMTTGKYGRSALVFVNLKDGKVSTGVQTGDNFEIDRFFWVSSQRVVYTVAERQLGWTEPSETGEIFAVDRTGRNHKLLYGVRAGESAIGTRLPVGEGTYGSATVVSTIKNDDQNILIAEYPWDTTLLYARVDRDAKPRISKLNVFTGRKDAIESVPLRHATVLVDRMDQVRFAFGRNDRMQLAISWKEQADGPWAQFDLSGFRAETVAPQAFSADNRSLILTAVREGESLAALYRLDLPTRAVEKLYGSDSVDVTEVRFDLVGGEVIGVGSDPDRHVHHWLDKDNPDARLSMSLDRAFPGQTVGINSASDDGRLAIVYVASDVNPGEYYVFDTKTMKADFLRAKRAWIDPRLMRPKQPIELTARDGVKLRGYVTQPAGEGPHPMVVLPHGGPHNGRDLGDFDEETQLFASRGYAVLQVNFRGSDGYGIDFREAGYRQWGAKMQDDVTDATRWAIEQRLAPANRICIYGSGYGGYAALMGASREPDLYRCAIGYAGYYDLELMLTSAEMPRFKSGQAYLARILGTDVADLRSRSPVHHAQDIKAPVLLIHGKQDFVADFEQAKRMKNALEEQHKYVELMALSQEGHIAYDNDASRQVYERILAFLHQHLMAP